MFTKLCTRAAALVNSALVNFGVVLPADPAAIFFELELVVFVMLLALGDPAALFVKLVFFVVVVSVKLLVEFWSVTLAKLLLALVFWLDVTFVVAKAVPALKGNAMINRNKITIIDFLLILPPPCPKDSMILLFEPF